MAEPRDSQGPRWEVFKQDAAGRPHQAVGSVHAADAEHALLTARHVFARRPRAVSLWVAPADAILSASAEELVTHPERFAPDADETGSDPEGRFLTFVKRGHRGSMTFVDHVGETRATSARAALRALVADEGGGEGIDAAVAFWVVPADALTASDPDAVESWFAPAEDKTYKQQSQYGFVKPRLRSRDDEGNDAQENDTREEARP